MVESCNDPTGRVLGKERLSTPPVTNLEVETMKGYYLLETSFLFREEK